MEINEFAINIIQGFFLRRKIRRGMGEGKIQRGGVTLSMNNIQEQ